MDETTEQVTSLHASRLIFVDGSQPSLLERRLQAERPVRSMSVVVLGVDPKDLLKMGPPENEKPVQALGAHRPDPALRVRVRLGCPDRRHQHLATLRAEHVVEAARELRVPIVEQEPHPAPLFAGRCCICCEPVPSRQTVVMRTHRPRPATIPRSAFAGFYFPPEVIVLAVRWYLRFAWSYRDVEELVAERGVEVDHVTVYRWVQRFTPLLAEAARPCRHAVGDRWQVDETYVKVAGRWRYVYRAIDQFGQVIDVFVSSQRDAKAARRFFEQAISTTKVTPVE